MASMAGVGAFKLFTAMGIAECVVEALVGTATGAAATRIAKDAVARILGGGVPENHDVLKALHAAFVGSLDAMGAAIRFVGDEPADNKSREKFWAFLKSSTLRSVNLESPVLPAEALNGRIERLFQDDFDTRRKSATEAVIAMVSEAMGARLSPAHAAVFRAGVTIESTVYLSWVQYFDLHFAEQIKTKPRVSNILDYLDRQELKELSREQLAAIEAIRDAVALGFASIGGDIGRLHAEVRSGNASTAQRLDEIREAVTPHARPKPWQLLTPADFEAPAGAVDEARAYLRGEQVTPFWTARHVAVWRGDEVAALYALADAHPLLFVQGPMGHGKSTLVRQLAWHWIDQGRRVLWLNGPDAFDDDRLFDDCMLRERPLLIMDDRLLDRKPPDWLRWEQAHGATILITTQSRLVPQQKKRVRDWDSAAYSVPVPRDPEPFLDRLIAHGAAHSADPDQVRQLFQDGLGQDGRGGLWTAYWQATRGEKLDARVKRIVAEFADRENGDLYALAATTFLNTYLEYAQDYRRGYETTLQSRRSLVRGLIAQMPWSDRVTAMALDSLDNIGASLDDEFLQRATLASRLDDETDPFLAFRSGPLTHAFNRWIFGAVRADDGEMRVPRWPFYDALAKAMRDMGQPQREFPPLLRNYNEAWHVPNYRPYTDNGRADFAPDALAKALWDQGMAAGANGANLAAQCRLNLHLARSCFEAAYPHHSREKVPPERIGELVAVAEGRLAAATASELCPVDVLRSAFDLLASHRQPIEAGEDGDGLALATLADRVKAHPATKAFDRAKIDLGLMRAQAKAGDAAALAAFTRLKPLALALFVKDHESIRIMQDLVRIIARDRDASFGMPAAADTADAPALQPLDRFVAFIVHAWGAMAAARIPTLRAKAAAPSAQNDHILSRYRDVVTRLDAMTEWHPSLADIRGFGAVRGAAARLAETPPDLGAIADMVTMLGNARPPFEGLGDKGTVAAKSDDGDEEDEAGDEEAGDGITA